MKENKGKKGMSEAMVFLLLCGTVSLFSDMTHEGASSIRGAYMALLGAGAGTIGFVSGFGELIGYSMRYVFGRFTDKTKLYWPMVMLGYALDIVAVPALALVGDNGWMAACLLLLIQRMGKAIKKPAKSTIMSFAATQEGVGKSFGIQEVLDQIGAALGPLFLYMIMLFKTEGTEREIYSSCFAFLAVPGVITMIILIITKKKFPNPDRFEPEPKEYIPFKMSRSFIFYIMGISLFAFGFVDYSLVVMHVRNRAIISSSSLPLLYSAAMIIDALSAFVFGMLFDRIGVKTLVWSTLLSSTFAAFVFLTSSVPVLVAGVLLWGIGMGAQESILKAAVVKMVPKQSRATGYGIFECSFGIFWFLGSWILGSLYDVNIPAMVAVSVLTQLLSVPFYLASRKAERA